MRQGPKGTAAEFSTPQEYKVPSRKAKPPNGDTILAQMLKIDCCQSSKKLSSARLLLLGHLGASVVIRSFATSAIAVAAAKSNLLMDINTPTPRDGAKAM